MMTTVTFLGTGTGTGWSPDRQQSSLALTLGQGATEPPLHFLFDCGENTLRQMRRAKLKLNRLAGVFITHFHFDHIMGLPGLLSVLGPDHFRSPARTLVIAGPPGIKNFIDYVMPFTGSTMTSPFTVREIPASGGDVEVTSWGKIAAVPVDHEDMTCFAYCFRENEYPGNLNIAQANRRGVTLSDAMIRDLKEGNNVRLASGEVLTPKDWLINRRPGKCVVISGDNSRPGSLVRFTKRCDLLIHEATYKFPRESDAASHTSISQVAQAAEEQGDVKHLALTHLGAQVSKMTSEQITAVAKQHYSGTVFVAEDLLRLQVATDGSVTSLPCQHPTHKAHRGSARNEKPLPEEDER